MRTRRTGTANRPVEYHTAVWEAISTMRSALPYQFAIIVGFQTVAGSWATSEGLGKRSPLRRGLPISDLGSSGTFHDVRYPLTSPN
jgi:hypothetical protein